MFCQCMWGGGAAPSPPTPLQPALPLLQALQSMYIHSINKTIPDPFAFAARAGLWWWCVLVPVLVRLLSLALLVPLCWCLWCFERVPCCHPHSLAAAGAGPAIFVLLHWSEAKPVTRIASKTWKIPQARMEKVKLEKNCPKRRKKIANLDWPPK